MNILILTTHMNQGGISRYVLNLVYGLCPEHRVWVASSGGEWEKRIETYGASFYRIPVRTKSLLSPGIEISVLKLLPFLVRHKIDAIMANTRVTQFLAYILSRCSGIPYVSVYHGFYRPSWERKLMKFEGVRTIAVSRSVIRHCSQDLRINSDKLRLVYNGINQQDFAFLPEKKNRVKGPVLGMLGRISAEKGHFMALEAFKLLRSDYEHISLLISGKGRMREELKARIVQDGLDNKVRLLALEGEKFLDLVDILLFPSSQEGFGLSILESFAKKVPVIASAQGGIKEVIKDRETGFLFSEYSARALADTVREVIADNGLRNKVISRAYDCLDQFTLKAMAENTLKVLEEAVQT